MNNLVYIGPSYNNLGNHLIKGKTYHVDLVMFGNQNRYMVTELESEESKYIENLIRKDMEEKGKEIIKKF